MFPFKYYGNKKYFVTRVCDLIENDHNYVKWKIIVFTVNYRYMCCHDNKNAFKYSADDSDKNMTYFFISD